MINILSSLGNIFILLEIILIKICRNMYLKAVAKVDFRWRLPLDLQEEEFLAKLIFQTDHIAWLDSLVYLLGN